MTSATKPIPRATLLLFAATLFTGAFLLFQIQPLIAKYILPWFGGSSAVWTTCILFFQLFLLAGYAYSHIAHKFLRPRVQIAVHILLLILAGAALPIIPSSNWKPQSADDPTWRILALLTFSIGLPYLLISSTGPMLQAWLTRISPAASPYRLFALSNFASLTALLTYPFLIEPFLSRRAQAIAWSVAFIIFALLSTSCALVYQKNRTAFGNSQSHAVDAPASSFTRLMWLLLPACATLLLLAITNKICQEVAVIPFLWILPLAIYLLTFVIAFDNPRWYRRDVFLALLPMGIAGIILMLLLGGSVPISLQLGVHCGVLFVACLICHGELARLKPPASKLTAYYLYLCAGGAMGGLFVAVIAPLIFTSYFELPLGLLLIAMITGAVVASDPASRLYKGKPRWTWLTLLMVYLLLGFFLVTAHIGTSDRIIAASRSFYGTLAVIARDQDDPQRQSHVFRHGSITHGIQFTSEERRHEPTAYFGPQSGAGLALANFLGAGPRKIGIVGLGAGTLALYARPGDAFRFYEINPQALKLAQSHFTFLKDSPAHIDNILGDARLSLEREPDQHFDILILDAFNGDAIPVHLLTREAFDLYRWHLKPDGLIVVQLTNHYLDLRPVVQGAADYLHLQSLYIFDKQANGRATLYTSQWMLLSRDETFLHSLPVPASTASPSAAPPHLWTDDQSSLFRILR